MFRRFQKLADPFIAFDDGTPPNRVWPFLVQHLAPLRHIIAISLVLSVIGAGIEVWLIGYAGTLVDTLAATTPAQLWALHGTELIAVAAVVLIGRPLNSFLREGLNDIAFRPNAETLVRWRSHRHVLRQSVG